VIPSAAKQLLESLTRAGVRLDADVGGLAYDGPAGAMTPALKAAVAHHKQALLG
jgi:hypothetical protein